MKISGLQKQVLASLVLDTRAPLSRIARAVRAKEHRVRYAAETCKQQELLRPFLMLNISALGLSDYCLFLSYSSSGVSRRRVSQFLCSCPQVAYAAELAGEFQLAVSVLAQDVSEVDTFLRSFTAECGASIVNKSIAIRVSWTLFPPRFLSEHVSRSKPLRRAAGKVSIAIDETDRRILAALASQPEASFSEIARRLSLPVTTLDYRTKALESKKVIIGYPAYLSALNLGLQEYRLLITRRGTDPSFEEELYGYVQKLPSVMHLVHCLGSWDDELNVYVSHPDEMLRIVEGLYELFGERLLQIRMLSTLKRLKANQFPFHA